MTNPIIIIHNAETGETIEREMNAQEYKQWQTDQANATAKLQAELEIQNKKIIAENKLAALGLNADDLRALGL